MKSRPLTLGAWLLLGYGLLMVGLVVAPVFGLPSETAAIFRSVAPFAAAILCLAALRTLPVSATPPWAFFALAALSATIAPAFESSFVAMRFPLAPSITMLVAAVSFCAAVGAALFIRERGRRPEFILDGILVMLAAVVVTLRWAPGLRPILNGEVPFGGPETIIQVAAPIISMGGVLFATMLLAARRPTSVRDAVSALVGAAVLLLIAGSQALLVPGACCTHVAPLDLAGAGAWGLLAFAGAQVVQGGTGSFVGAAGGFADAPEPAARARLRQVVSPIAALVMALAVVDGGLHPPLQDVTAGAIGLLGAVLALRVSQLLEATRHRLAEQRQLEQSQALVEVSRALSGSTELDETLERVTQWTCRLLNGQSAIIELPTENWKHLEIHATAGLPPDVLGMRFPIDDSFTGWVMRYGRPRATVDPRREPDIKPSSLPFVGKSPLASAPMRYQGRVLGVLTCVADRPFDPADFELLGALADQGAIALENARLFKQVDRMSKTDPLTNLSNRRQLEADLAREFAAAQRGRPLICVMFDLNDFKKYNDEYGHLAGDEALRMFGKVLATETREMNLAARYGGDEFIALLTDSHFEGAQVFAERVRSRYMRLAVELRRRSPGVAYGFAAFTESMETPADLLEAADRELYAFKANKAKAAGNA